MTARQNPQTRILNEPEAELLWQITAVLGLDGWGTQYKFDKVRQWRFDLANLDWKLAIEIEGGLYSGGRDGQAGDHTRGKRIEADMEKYGEAMCQGWMVLRVSPAMVKDGRALAWIERILEERRAHEAQLHIGGPT